jgi:hypothetical protein
VEIEYRNIKPAKRWNVKEAIQTKFGSWYSFVADPNTNEVVYETYGFSKKQTTDSCVEWCMTNNRYAAEIESAIQQQNALNNIGDTTNANTTTMGSALAENCSGNITTEQGPDNQSGSSSSQS